MKTAGQGEHAISSVFVFMLLGVFMVFGMLMIVLGVRAYQSTESRTAGNNQYRLLSSYVRSMVRSEDGLADIHVEELDGIRMLSMEESYDGDKYVTRIYVSDGKLREWFSSAENPFDPAAGDEICDAGDFEAEIQNGLLTARVQDTDGGWIDVRVALYAGGAGREFS